MGQLKYLLFSLLLLEWNQRIIARSPVKLQLSLTNTDGSVSQVSQALKQYLAGLNISPGQSLSIDVVPPIGVRDAFMQTILQCAKTVVSQLVPNAGISFKIGGSKSSDGTLSNIQLGIDLGEAVGGGGGAGGDNGGSDNNIPSSNIRNVNLDLSSSGSNPSGPISQQLTQIVRTLKPQLNQGQPVQITLNISPPRGSTQPYVNNVMSILRTLLTNLVPTSMQSGVKATMQGNNDGTISSMQVTITITSVTGSGGNNSNGQQLTLDLSQFGVDIPAAVRSVLQTIVQNLSGAAVKFNLQITPPIGATKIIVQNIVQIINSVLATLIPNAHLSIRTSMSQGPLGTISNVNCEINIEPSSSNNPNQVNFNLDISKPGTDLVQEVTNILPNIENQVNPILNNGEPVTLNLNIQPPQGVPQQFVESTTDTVASLLQQVLPNKIKVTTTANKDPQGRILMVTLVFTIQPENAIIEVDLSKPGSSLVQEITNIIPDLKDKVTRDQPKKKPVIVNLNIIPPKGSTDQFVKNTMNTVLTTLSQIFPENKLGIQAKSTKDPQGRISSINLITTIQPNPNAKQPDNEETINIDLTKPGSNIIQEVTNVLPELEDKVNKEQPKGEPVKFNLYIQPPRGTSMEFVKDTMDTILTTLSDVFPFNKIDANAKSTKDSSGNILEVTLVFTIQPNPNGQTPNNPEVLNVDMTRPGSDLVQEVTNILPNLKNKVNKEQPKGEPVKFELNIQPPKGSTDQFVKDTMNTVLTTVSQIFPNNKLGVQAKTTKDPRGNISNVTLVVTIEPNPNAKNPNNEVVNVDLTKPGTDLVQEVTNILPDLKDKVNKEQPEGEPVNFELNIQPPKGSTDQFVKDTMNTVLTTLSQIFPNNKLGVQAKTTKDPRGNISNVSLVVTIQPNPNGKKPNNEVVNVDLTRPGSDLIQEVTNILPDLKDKVNEQQPQGEPVNFELNIQPPKGSTDQFVKDTMNTVLTTLSQIFPNNKLGVQAKTTKDPRGNISNVSLVITIQPNPNAKKPNNEVVNVDLTRPGTDLIQEVTNILPDLKDKVNEEQPLGEPVNFELNIQPPKGSTDKFVKDTMNTVLTTLSQIFPNNKLGVQAKTTKDPNGNISNVSLIITIQPNPNEEEPNSEEINVDLTKPGSDLVQEITNVLPNLINKVNNQKPQDEPVNFELNIKPPKGTTDKFVKDTMNSVLITLSQIFPNNKLGVQAKTTKDPKGNISNVNFVVTIQPNPNGKEPKNPEAVTIDLTKPGNDLVQEITNVLPRLQDKVDKQQPNGEPVNFELNIQPPRGSNDQFVKDTMNTVLTTLSQIFPSNKLGVQAKTTKDPNGNISNVNLVVNIEPNPNPQKPKNPEAVNVDLTKPGSDLVQEVTDILPDLKDKVNKEQPKGEPVNFELNIQPPKGSTDQFVTNTLNTVLTTLSKIFPNNKVGVQAHTTKDPRGNISNVSVIVTIEPNPNIKQPNGEEPNNNLVVSVDLSKPGTNLVQELTKILPDLTKSVKEEEPKDEPVSFNLNIQPPNGATDDFVKKTTNTLLTTLSQIFPNNKVGIKTQTVKNPQGYVTDVIVIITVEPSEPTGTTRRPNKENEIDFDLTKPGSNLVSEISSILPKVKDELDEKQPNGEPVNFELNIRPPKGSTDQFARDTTKTILTTLSQIFPENKVGVTSRTTKDPSGNIIEVIFTITIEPSSSTQSPFVENVVTPGNPSENSRESATTPSTNNPWEEFEIKTTPSGKNPLEGLVSRTTPSSNNPWKEVVSKTTPSGRNPLEDLWSRTTTPGKNPLEGLVSRTTPSGNNPWEEVVSKTTPSGRNPLEDLWSRTTTPGKNPLEELPSRTTPSGNNQWEEFVSKTTPSGRNPLEDLGSRTTPSPRNPLDDSSIAWPTPSNEVESQELFRTTPTNKNPLEELISREEQPKTTPSNKNPWEEFTLETTPSSEIISEDIVVTTPSTRKIWEERTTPSTSEITSGTVKPKEIDINLSKPGSNIETTVSELLPKIVPDVQKDLDKDKPTTLSFNIQPPKGVNQDFLTTTTESLVPILSKYFPDNKIHVTTQAKKDPQGNIVDVILLITLEPSTKPKPKEENVDVDLSRPGVTLEDQISKELPTVVTTVEKNVDNGQPITLNFNIRPPVGSTEEYLQTTTESLMSIISKYFPNNRVTVSTSAQKNPQGYLSDILLKITFEPSPRPKEENVDIDLSRPGKTLGDEVDKKLPNIVPDVSSNLDEGRPVTVNFNIKPPQGSTQEYLQVTTQSLVPILSKYFPNNQISIKTSAQKNPLGYLTDMILEITFKPAKPRRPNEENVDIDLSRPGVTLNNEVDKKLPNVVPDITSNLNKGRPVTVNFNIKPPRKSTDKYLQVTTQSLVPILSKYFPNNKISIKTSAQKNPQGYLTDMILEITFEPSPQGQPEQKNVDIDLSRPGVTLNNEVDKKLPNVVPDVNSNLNKGRPVTLNFNIKPPRGSTDKYLQITTQSLVPILSKYFPNNKINLKTSAQKNPQGYLTDMILEITVEPSSQGQPQQENVDIDLSRPGVTLNNEVDKKLPNVVPDVNSNLNKGRPVTLNFNIKPPRGSTDKYLQITTQSLVPILSKYFPNNKINLKTSAQKNPQGYLTDMILEITVEPSPQGQPGQENVDIDLSRPGVTLNNEVDKKLPNVVPDINSNLQKGRPVTLNFNIKPPRGSTDKYLQVTTQSLVPILSKYFPNNKINVKTSAQKNPQGYLTDMILEITVEPSPQGQPGQENVDIDLSRPGVTLNNEVDKKLPNVVPDINSNLNKGRPVTINFNIKPPQGSTDKYLQVTTQSLVPILSKYFPNNKISLKTSAQKNPQGYLTDMILEITVQPSSQGQPQPKNVDIDLSKPGATLINQVSRDLPSVVTSVQNDLNNNKPVTLNFNVRPPNRSRDSYLKTLTNQLMPMLVKYFPKNKIGVKTSAQKSPNGFLSDITLIITVEPVGTGNQPNQKNVDIDLSRPGSNLVVQVNNVLPNILNDVKNILNNRQPVSLSFNIKPPARSTDSYLQTVTNQLVPVLSQYFPNNQISVKASGQKNPSGYFTLIILVITIQPSGGGQSPQQNIDIDLSKRGVTLTGEVNKILPSLSTSLQNYLQLGQIVTLNFNIQPPAFSREIYLKTLTNQLTPILSRYFPNYQINVKSSSKKNARGYLSNILLIITIQQNNGLNVNFDLSRSGSNLVMLVKQAFPKLMIDLTNKLRLGNSVVINFNIKPPRGATTAYVKSTTNSLIPILSALLPNYRINVKANANQMASGLVTEFVIVITIQPA